MNISLSPRKQGRPTRSSGLNGRDALIEGTRSYLRSRSKLALTRSEIAQGCGVTPALISYYFKGQKSLLEAVTKPLIRSYNHKLTAIRNKDDDAGAKMRAVIRLLVEMNMDDAFLVDYLTQDVGLSNLDDEDRGVTDLFRDTISDLIALLMASGHWRTAELAKTRLCLWASCRVLGETLYAQDRHAASHAFNRADALDQSASFIDAIFAKREVAEVAEELKAAL